MEEVLRSDIFQSRLVSNPQCSLHYHLISYFFVAIHTYRTSPGYQLYFKAEENLQDGV